MRKLIRANGTETDLYGPQGLDDIKRLIGASVLDSVRLKIRGLVMFVDDSGALTDKPVNQFATTLYHEVCKPGTTWQIHGDVVVVPAYDFGD